MMSTEYHDKISRLFSIAANDIKINNVGYNYFNINKFAETCIARIFSLIYGVEFIVLEDVNVNFPAVDIGAVDGSIYAQITSETGAKKIKKTLATVVKNNLQKEYDTLQIMFLVMSYNPSVTKTNIKKYIKKETGKSVDLESIGFTLDTSIVDFTNLAKLIRSKVFKVDTLHEIFEVLEQEYQYYRYATEALDNLPFESLASSINDVLSKKDLRNSLLYLAKYYYPSIVIPQSLIKNLYPFNTDKNLFVENYSLTISDVKVFKEFEKLLEDPISNIWSDDLKSITKFLRYNGIAFIQLMGKRDVISVPIYENEVECDCERCCYERMDFTGVLEQLTKIRMKREYSDVEYPLRVIYTSIKVGDYLLAKDLCEYFIVNGDKNNRIEQFILESNLYKICMRFNLSPSFEDGRGIVFPSNLIASYAYQGVEKENNLFLSWLNSEDYILKSVNRLQKLRIRARDNSISDVYGQPALMSNAFELSKSFNLPVRVHWGNLFPDLDSENYHHFLIDSIAVFFEIYSVNFQNFSDVQPDSYLNIWIRDTPTPLLRNLLYSIPDKKIKRKFVDKRIDTFKFIKRLSKLTRSVENVERYVSSTDNKGVKGSFIRALNNTLLFARKFELNDSEYSVIVSTIGETIRYYPKFLEKVVSDFCFLVHIRFSSMSTANKNLVENLYLEVPKIQEYQRTRNIKKFGTRLTDFQSGFDEQFEFIEQSLKKNGMGYELNSMFDDIEFISDGQIEKFKSLLNKALSKRSTPILIYEGVINDMISLNDFKSRFIEETLGRRKEQRYRSYRDKNNQDFDYLIGMHFHSGIPTSSLSKYAPDTEYYNWLINISNYEYNKFEHRWILRNQSEPFLKEYKKHQDLIKSLIKKQKEEMIEGVSWMLFNSLLN